MCSPGVHSLPCLPCPIVGNVSENVKLSFRKKLWDWSGLDGLYFWGSCSLGEDGKLSQHLGWSNAAPQDASHRQDFQVILVSRFHHQKLLPGGIWTWVDVVHRYPLPSSLMTTMKHAQFNLHAFLCLHDSRELNHDKMYSPEVPCDANIQGDNWKS